MRDLISSRQENVKINLDTHKEMKRAVNTKKVNLKDSFVCLIAIKNNDYSNSVFWQL